MILFCGIPTESPLALAIEAAETLALDHVVFHQRHVHFNDVTLDVRGGRATGLLRMWGHEFRLEQFSGVYARLMDQADLPENQVRFGVAPEPAVLERSRFLHDALNDWLEVASCPVVNRTSAMASNASKPFQAQHIRRAGFEIPDTLVTNDPADVRAFARTHSRVVYKSTSAIRSIVQELTAATSIDVLERVRWLPTQFQEFIDGTNVRVHVVGREVFATDVTTDAVDYRYAQRDGFDLEMRAASLPPTVADRCRALAGDLGLPLCGIDLKRSPGGAYYCFEVNPSPAYSYYQEQTGQPIADAIVRLLAGVAPAVEH
jgi:hypothetical protein